MALAGQQTTAFKAVQAINEDYRNTGYDRGHLNPNFYQCNDSRTATFTLTNAVPQDPCLNQQSWKKMEEVSLQTMRLNCSFSGAERYFVTGIVRSRTRIPNVEHDTEADRAREFNRVTVPSHMWTATCCHDRTNQGMGFSFAYIAKNKADSIVEILSVSDLEAKLISNDDMGTDRYQSIDIFVDDCNEKSLKSTRIRTQVSVPMDIRVANTLDDLSRVEQSSIPPRKRKLIHQAVSLITSNVVAAYGFSFSRIDLCITLSRNNDLIEKTRKILKAENVALLLFRAHDLSQLTTPPPPPQTEFDATSKQEHTIITVLRRRRKYLNTFDNHSQWGTNDEANNPVEDEYLIVPDLSADGSDVTIDGDHCVNSICTIGGGDYYRWCYTDWEKSVGQCCVSECKFRGDKDHQTCFTGVSNTEEKVCSSRFSTITVNGQRCLADHECGLHGSGYFWCYTDIAKNFDRCCQPWHACAKYGETYKWCYTGETTKSQYKQCYY